MMINILSVPVFVMAGICLFVASYHFWISIKKLNTPANLTFAVMCVCIAFYDIFSGFLYNAVTLEQGIHWQRLQIYTTVLMCIVFNWFFYYHTKSSARRYFTGLTVYFAVLFILGLWTDSSYTLTIAKPAVKQFTLLGIPVVYLEGVLGPVFQVMVISQMIGMFALLLMVFRYAMTNTSKGVLPLFFSISLFIVAGMNDSLVASQVYRFLYLMEYFYLIVILYMAHHLLNQFVQIHKEVETLNVELENRVTKRTLELENALSKVRQLAYKAESSNIAKSSFLANMSHEIRTPMNGLIGFTDLLADTRLDDTQMEYIRTIKQSGESLLFLLNDILDFSKIEAGELKLEHIEFDIEVLCYDVCDLLRPRIGSKPVTLLCHIGDALPARVMGDPNRLRQVMNNLMGNASKFTEEGEIELFLDLEDETEGRIMVHGQIRDTGMGIPESKMTQIFEPFQQADNSDTRKYGGTGLGLSICRQIIHLMDGVIWVESRVNEGSTFHFHIWLGKAETHHNRPLPPQSLTGKNVLICDRNQTSTNILLTIMKKSGMTCTGITDCGGMLPVLKQAGAEGVPFDLVIVSIHAPVFTELEAVKTIRSSGNPVNRIPMIALSSHMGLESRQCEQAGFNAYLSQPIRIEKLFRIISRMFSFDDHEIKNTSATSDHMITQYSIREDIKGVSILLGEDNPVNQKLAMLILTRAGYRVEVAGNGREVVDKFTARPDEYQLIIMDVHMPELDGLAATRLIRSKGYTDIPIVAMTAHAMKGFRETCLEAGMTDYISKPIQRDQVFKIITDCLLKTP